jgi:transposase
LHAACTITAASTVPKGHARRERRRRYPGRKRLDDRKALEGILFVPAHGSGLGRWVVERSFAWLHQFRRLATCYERRHDLHHALLGLGCCPMCWRRLTRQSL